MTTRAQLTAADEAQLRARGITREEIDRQAALLRTPPASAVLVRPCTIGDGIVQLSASEQSRLVSGGNALALAGRVMKFVPASGAASRMFKDLIAALASPSRPSDTPAAREFFERLDDFPFAATLRRLSGVAGAPATADDERRILRTMLEDMEFATLPKALIPFHRADRIRTALEEQLLAGTRYTRASDGTCRLHFTVAPEFRGRFEEALAELIPLVEQRIPGTRLQVTLSEQHPSTDTIAIEPGGELFRDTDGSLLFRPAGHGALLRNLQHLDADIIVIKNIDNIVPDEAGQTVVHWKRVLIGLLGEIEAAVFDHLRACADGNATDDVIDRALAFVQERFARAYDGPAGDRDAKRQFVRNALDRPIRVCGVVPNEGEPGGAPFWVKGDGGASVQIVESAQVSNDAEQQRIFRSSTHFNPVDMVCSVRSWEGAPFALDRFVDESASFVAKKSHGGRDLVALERPGLWNGAMAAWNTVCVEVPADTFAPVKTVLDLLRPQHQPRK